jgi:hypothetical protein
MEQVPDSRVSFQSPPATFPWEQRALPVPRFQQNFQFSELAQPAAEMPRDAAISTTALCLIDFLE